LPAAPAAEVPDVGSLPCGFRKPQIRAYRWCRPTKDRLRDNVPEPLNRTCAGCVLAKRKVRPHPRHGDPPRSLALLDIPIIGMSAHAVESERERAIATGCDEFDAKPIEFESLVATIWRVPRPTNRCSDRAGQDGAPPGRRTINIEPLPLRS